jgi:hypothetical protein
MVSALLVIICNLFLFRWILTLCYSLIRLEKISKQLNAEIDAASLEKLRLMDRNYIQSRYYEADPKISNVLNLTKWTYSQFYGETT